MYNILKEEVKENILAIIFYCISGCMNLFAIFLIWCYNTKENLTRKIISTILLIGIIVLVVFLIINFIKSINDILDKQYEEERKLRKSLGKKIEEIEELKKGE